MTTACSTTTQSAPLGVMWKTVSEDCNLACDYCYYSRLGGKLGHRVRRIESEVLERFIKQYMEFSGGVVSFAWQGGEPLLAGLDFFQEVIALQIKHAPANATISNSVQTNATLITDEWARFFKRYNFLVGVSLDGPKEIHDARRVAHSGNGSFDRVMGGVEKLRRHGVDFNILTVIHEGNVNKGAELMEFFQAEGFRYVQFIPCMDFRAQETAKPPRYLISAQDYGNFLCDVFDIWYNDGQLRTSVRFFDNMLAVYLNHSAEMCVHQKTCPTTLILEQNGDAYPCDFYLSEDYKLGNVGQDDLRDILGNYVHQRFLQRKPQLPEKCVTCEFQQLCHGGCPRNRHWDDSNNVVDVDYFCDAYLQIYQYADLRVKELARNIRIGWLKEYLAQGNKEPGRNDSCICGSGLKYKKCCGSLRSEVFTAVSERKMEQLERRV